MRGKRAWLCVLTGVLVASLMYPNSFNEVRASQVLVFTATVKSVVDGDTIHLKEDILGSHKVRFLSVDTPETKFMGHAQEPWGTEAAKYLASLIPPGTKVTVITDEVQKDQYGRLLAHIKKGDVDVNYELLRGGYAGMYYIYPNMEYFGLYRSALLEAMTAKRGIWSQDNPLPEEPFEFRFHVRHGYKGTDKYVGDFFKKTYVVPNDYEEIPTQNRVFFWSEKEAKRAGYVKETGANRLGI